MAIGRSSEMENLKKINICFDFLLDTTDDVFLTSQPNSSCIAACQHDDPQQDF